MPALYSLLGRYIDLIFPPREDERVVRGISREALAASVNPQLVADIGPAATALLPFRDAWVRSLVHEAKYHGSRRAFELLGDILGEYLLGLGGEESFGKIVIVPVPLSRARKRARGYNQAEEIARSALMRVSGGENSIGIRTDILVRTRDTTAQTSLARVDRKENLRGAFRAAKILDPSSTYIVFDDVITTGATLGAAAEALRLAGASRILPIAIAH